MKKRNVGRSGLMASEISLGCMRMASMDVAEVITLLDTALDCGIDLFDHADIYGGGKSERIFASALAQMPVARANSSCSNPSAASAKASLTFPRSTS